MNVKLLKAKVDNVNNYKNGVPVFVNIVVVSLFFNYSKEKPPYSR